MPGPPPGNGGDGPSSGNGGNSGNGGRSGGRGPRKPSGSKLLLDSLREACPAHKLKDLEELVKSLKGDEAKIRVKISEWWEEPSVESEGDWEDVNKKSAVLKNSSLNAPPKFQRGGRGGRDSGGRGRSRGGGGSDSARGSTGRGRGRFGERGGGGGLSSGFKPQLQPDGKPESVESAALMATMTTAADRPTETSSVAHPSAGVPVSGNTRAPQGAWAKRNAESSQPPVMEQAPAVVHHHEQYKPDTVVAPHLSSNVARPEMMAPPPIPSPPVPTMTPVEHTLPAVTAPTPTGNVWAMRGSAHLIQAEKPAPPSLPPTVATAPAPISRKHNGTSRKGGGGAGGGPRTTNIVVQDPVASSAVESVAALSITTSRNHDIAPGLPVPPPVEVVVAPPQQPIPLPPAPPHMSQVVVTPHLAPALTGPPPSTMSWSHQDKQVDSGPQHQQQQPVPVAPSMGVSERPKVEVTPATSVTTNTTTTMNVLNMGRWETADADDSMDFGFGSFGHDKNDDVDTNESNTNSGASPARPPPGLSITGMPPMPTNAVLVHELENKLEDVSVSKQHHHPHQQVQDNHQSTGIGSLAPTSHQLPQNIHQPHMSMHDTHLSSQQQQQPIYGGNQYGSGASMGMYGNYNVGGANAGHTFMNMPGTGVGPGIGQPHQGPHAKGPTLPPQQQPQPNLYNQAPTSGNAPVVGTPAGVAGNDSVGGPNINSTTSGGMPPGMPGMPYGNPMYYGQQQFHIPHNQPGIGYNYGYGGQFGGGVQGGFGYPGGMHGNAGYGHGGPQYDDHQGAVAGPTAHGPAGSAGVGGYNSQNPQQQQSQPTKNSGGGNAGGGYRGGGGGGGGGRHNNNQYQQYNPQPQHHQHAGYGNPPYGMGYGDHFNQRGGYQNMQDPYAMQQQQQGSGNYGGGTFQGDNQYKGKKSNRGGLNQFQQQGPLNQHLPGQQSFGLQGQGGAEANQQSSDGWSNQGGWSGGGAGSGSGSSGWQGAK